MIATAAAPPPGPLGLKRVESIHFYAHDLERTRRFLCDHLDFAEVGESSPELTREGRQKSRVFQAGTARFVVSAPAGEGGRAARFLRKHPEGVGTIVFEVADIDSTYRALLERGGTFITEIQRFEQDGGKMAMFSITTPFGDTTFRFIARSHWKGLYPGFIQYAEPRGGKNRFGFEIIDHITSNFQTMKPALLWLEHVMGFQHFWEVQFHTMDVNNDQTKGSGLRSQVMWEPASYARFANNEPWGPHFKDSQINIFGEDHRGDGVQHVALTVPDILSTVRGMRAAGVEFMPTPGSYYDAMPARLEEIGVGGIDENIDELRELGILVDGGKEHSYMLQIFLKEAAGLHKDPEAGPFFFEIVQRKGDKGFGAGNFRALFESIEREQQAVGRA